MKNEVLVKAITEIDDELIVSAHRIGFLNRKRRTYFAICAAACLLLVCGIMFLSHSGRMKICTNGHVVSSQPVAIAMPDVLPANARQANQDILTVPLEIRTKENFIMKTADGMLEVFSAKADELLYIGQFCELKGPVTVQWTIENPNVSQTYKIGFNHMSLILKYDQNSNNWTINKTED